MWFKASGFYRVCSVVGLGLRVVVQGFGLFWVCSVVGLGLRVVVQGFGVLSGLFGCGFRA